MSNTIKKCKSCKGSGFLPLSEPPVICPSCKGLGTPIYDEDYDRALPFLGENEDNFVDEENE